MPRLTQELYTRSSGVYVAVMEGVVVGCVEVIHCLLILIEPEGLLSKWLIVKDGCFLNSF